jgi:uncharacterized protein YdhG (YjbR/CyaY superfamily)
VENKSLTECPTINDLRLGKSPVTPENLVLTRQKDFSFRLVGRLLLNKHKKEGELMENNRVGFVSIDEYIATLSKEIQKKLEELRATIKTAAPDAEEKISYQMPTFALKGNLVHFAAHKNHIGFYPTPTGIQAFKNELSIYEGAKGSVKFPIDKPLPLKLISKIVKFRVAENLKNAETKSSKKK